MLRLPPFRFRPAKTVAEAAAILAGEGPSARVVAGGTDLWPNMKRRHQHAETVVGLATVPELRGVRDGRGGLGIGATTVLADVAGHPEVGARFPALARAVASISSPPLRNMGTLGGNLCVDTRCTYYNQPEHWRQSIDYCMKEAGQTCWVAPSSPRCWAHAASDSAPMLTALGARVTLVSSTGRRRVALAELYRDDGIDFLIKRPDEILTEIEVPASAGRERCRASFWKLRRRGSIDFAVLSAAVALWTDGDVVRDARIVLGAVASAPLSLPDAAAILVGQPLGDAGAIAAAAALARKRATPMDNTDFQTQWRGRMVEQYTAAALKEAAGLDPQIRPPRHTRT